MDSRLSRGGAPLGNIPSSAAKLCSVGHYCILSFSFPPTSNLLVWEAWRLALWLQPADSYQDLHPRSAALM